MPYNLQSRSSLREPCTLDELDAWFERELQQIPIGAEHQVLSMVVEALPQFVSWPKEALLLWQGCDRVPVAGRPQRYHSYPDRLKALAKERQIKLDTRPNGPAIAAFLLAGGQRPKRVGSSNAWSVHHLYSGKFPYVGREVTTHATKSGVHFTQSAGLIATHPVADALVDEYPFFAWLLRARAFLRFGYDPDQVFSTVTDLLGFAEGATSLIVCDKT